MSIYLVSGLIFQGHDSDKQPMPVYMDLDFIVRG